MANTILTIDMITKEMMRLFKNNLALGKSVNRQHEAEFGKKGNKIGDTLRVRKPVQATVTDGVTLSIQDIVETKVDLVIDKNKHVGLAYTMSDLTLKMEEFSERVLKPVIVPLANQVDQDIAALYKDVYNIIGAAGTANTNLSNYLDLNAYMTDQACPLDPRSAIIDPFAQSKIVNGLSGLFQSSEQIASQYEKGVMGIAAGMKWKMDQNIKAHTWGQRGGTPLINGSTATGATSIVTDGWSNSITGLVKQGDVFTIAGVYAVNPVSKETLSYLQRFVATADANSNGSGQATISISPTIYSSASGALQNVSALPADNAALTFLDTASAIGKQGIIMHPDAFTLAMVGLEVPTAGGKGMTITDPDSGFILNYAEQYDITNRRNVYRIDAVYGVKALRPEWAGRIQS